MATVQNRSGKLFVAFRYAGKQYTRLVPGEDRSEAEARRKLVEVVIHDLEHGRLMLPPDCTDVGTFIMSAGKVSDPVKPPVYATLQELWDGYRQVSVTSENTKTTEAVHFGHLLRILGPDAALPLLTTANLQGYIRQRSEANGIRGEKLSPVTIRKEIATLRSVWNGYALPQAMVKVQFQSHFIGKLSFPKQTTKPPFQTFDQIQRQIVKNHLTEAERANLWDSLFLDRGQLVEILTLIRTNADNPAWLYPMVLCAAHTGCRKSELLRSQPEDFDLPTNTVHWREKKRVPCSNEMSRKLRTVYATVP